MYLKDVRVWRRMSGRRASVICGGEVHPFGKGRSGKYNVSFFCSL